MKNVLWTFQAVCVLGVLSGCSGALSSGNQTGPARLATSHDQATIQALHRRLQQRERTIAIQNYQIDVLVSQLDALKRIDQDTQKQRRSVRNSITFVP